MKKIAVAGLLFLLMNSAFARAPYSEFKVGYLYPEDTKSGYLFGVNLGRMIDESLSWSFEFNYFQKKYNKVSTVYQEETPGGNIIIGKEKSLEFNTRIIPVFAKLNYEHPIGPRSPLYLRASAGLGWELLWNKEDNFEDDYHKKRFFHGFGWQGSAGLGIEISSTANFFLDAVYNGSTVKRNQTKNDIGMPTWEEINISGFGFRFGISIVGFGW